MIANYQILSAIMAEFKLKNDAALSQFLDVGAPQISRIRHGRYNVSSHMILRIYDKTGWSIEKIRSYLEDSE